MLAFCFPGQGSQRPGMGAPWIDHPSWELVADASDAAGRDIGSLLLHADEDELRHTRNAQLATCTLSLVVLDAVERTGLIPGLAAGHSLGEYSALIATGAVGFEDGMRLVAARGEAMQEAAAARPGTMAVVLGLDIDQCHEACARATGTNPAAGVWVANDNAPGQVGIAGTVEGVAAAGEIAKELGAKRVMAIPVGGAFHTPLMAPAQEQLRKALAEVRFNDADVPVVTNVDAKSHRHAVRWAEFLTRQLCSPVRWRESLSELGAMGASMLVEIGPGNVLTGLAKRGLPGVKARSVATPDDVDALLEAIAPVAHLTNAAPIAEGEHLAMRERLVVSPAAGVFAPASVGTAVGAAVEVGGLLGTVADVDVRSAFAGTLQGMLAVDGERLIEGQPVAWLMGG